MADSEALLLVDDDQAQVMRVHIAAEQPVRAHQDVDVALGETRQRRRLLRLAAEARQDLDRDAERLATLLEVDVVLLREDRRRAQDHDLLAVLRRLEGGPQRHLGFAEADVAADEAVHRLGGLHVGLDVGDGGQLIGRLLVRERLLHLALGGRVGPEAVPLHRGAARVHVDEVERELLGRLARLLERA